MRVRIDEAREEIRVPQVNHVSRRRSRVARADIRDAPVFNSDGAVVNWRMGYWQNPFRRVKAKRRWARGAGR